MILRLAIILMFIASVAAGGLALLNTSTAPIIAENKRIEQEQARMEVVSELADSIRFEEVSGADSFTYWKAFDENGNLIGYAGVALGKGYSSTIETVSGFDKDFKVSGLKVTFQQETPGLGTKVQEIKSGESDPWFLRQFKGKLASALAVVQDRGDIDAITGATISSRALSNSVRDLAAEIQQRLADSDSMTAGDDMSLEDSNGEEFDDSVDMNREYHDEESEVDEYSDEEAE